MSIFLTKTQESVLSDKIRGMEKIIGQLAQQTGLKEAEVEGVLNLIKSAGKLEFSDLILQTGVPEATLQNLLTKINGLPKEFINNNDFSPYIWSLVNFDDVAIEESIKIVREKHKLTAKREYDQFFATPKTSVAKSLIMKTKGALDKKRLLILGDDDLVSLTANLVGKPSLTTVYEIDPDIIKIINDEKESRGWEIKIVEADLRKPLRSAGNFDTVITDPPYTPMGITLFLRRAIEGLQKGEGKYIFLCFGASFKTNERFLKIQEIINSFNLVIEDKIDKFNHYFGAKSIGSASSIYVLRTTNTTTADSIYYNEKDIYTYQNTSVAKFPYIEHHTLRLFEIPIKVLENKKELIARLEKVLKDLKLNAVTSSYKKFPGGGITINFVLSQSNMTIHTWPELMLLHVDILTCSPIQSRNSIPQIFSTYFETKSLEYKRLE